MSRPCNVSSECRSLHERSFHRENSFLSGDELTLPLNLYIDDFEVCNPLGTSRKKHKVTSHLVFADIPATLRSNLSLIYLAILCKADAVTQYGYPEMLRPLLKDLKCLENIGISGEGHCI